jgi:integrase
MLITVYKRKRKGGFTWYANIRIRRKGQPSVRHREALPGVTTKYDALQEAEKVGARVYDEHFGTPPPKDKLFSDFITEDFIPWAETNTKHPANYKSVVRAWSELECLKDKTVREISTFDIERAKIERARGKTKREAQRSQRTVNAELIIASSVFHRAIDDRLADSNPVSGVEHFEIPASPPRVLSFDEEERLMPVAAEADPYLLPFITLALGTGMREMEMLKIRKPQLDFSRGLIFVTNPKWPHDPRATKGVPMSQKVKETLREWASQSEGELVFPSPHDESRNLSKSTIIRVFNAACEKAKIRGMTIHKLRHTFGTRLGDAGYSTQEIADLMGHSDIKMARIYVHTSRDRQRSAVESVWTNRAQVIELGKAN